MAKTITLSLNTKLIIEAVKADTYITGAIDKSADAVKNSALAYNEQAGDDTYHERKLKRTLAGAVGSLEANLAEFVDSASSNGITDTLANAGEDGAFTIVILVSERYNNGLAYPIAQLAQEYIVNKMLYYWWQSIRPALAKDYLSFSAESLTNIRLCLAKTAPNISEASYEDVTGEVAGTGAGNGSTITVASPNLNQGQFTVAYDAIVNMFASYGNLKLTCSDPSTQFDVKLDTAAPAIFSIGYTPYNFSQNNIFALMQNHGAEQNVTFVPKVQPASGTIIVITSKSGS